MAKGKALYYHNIPYVYNCKQDDNSFKSIYMRIPFKEQINDKNPNHPDFARKIGQAFYVYAKMIDNKIIQHFIKVEQDEEYSRDADELDQQYQREINNIEQEITQHFVKVELDEAYSRDADELDQQYQREVNNIEQEITEQANLYSDESRKAMKIKNTVTGAIILSQALLALKDFCQASFFSRTFNQIWDNTYHRAEHQLKRTFKCDKNMQLYLMIDDRRNLAKNDASLQSFYNVKPARNGKIMFRCGMFRVPAYSRYRGDVNVHLVRDVNQVNFIISKA
eukprot:Pgem_evm1s10637